MNLRRIAWFPCDRVANRMSTRMDGGTVSVYIVGTGNRCEAYR